jgi:hypothetical protein
MVVSFLVLAFIVGCFIGWNFDQPEQVKAFQEWILSKFRN